MLRELVQYSDFDGVNRSENVYFYISKAELMDNLHLQPQLEALSKKLEGPLTELPMPLVVEILEVVKTMMKLAYGERSEDGKRFVKSEELWTNFTQTPVYDALLYSLFTDVERATKFLAGLLPQDLVEQARVETAVADPLGKVESLPEPGRVTEEASVEKTEYDYTRAELMSMPREQFDRIVGTNPQRMSRLGLQVATQRRLAEKDQAGGPAE